MDVFRILVVCLTILFVGAIANADLCVDGAKVIERVVYVKKPETREMVFNDDLFVCYKKNLIEVD